MSTIKTQVHNILKKFEKGSIAEVVEMLQELQIFDYLHNIKKVDE